jgi:hypothetical protein
MFSRFSVPMDYIVTNFNMFIIIIMIEGKFNKFNLNKA